MLFAEFAGGGAVFEGGEVFGGGVGEVSFLFLEGEMAEGILEWSGDKRDVYGVGFAPFDEMFFDFFHDGDVVLSVSLGLVLEIFCQLFFRTGWLTRCEW